VLEPFKSSAPFTMGVELELQLVNRRDFDLTRGAESLLAALAGSPRASAVKPEITESMIELNSAVHQEHGALEADLADIRDALCAAAAKLNIGVSGGGAHPFHRWAERRVFPAERFAELSELYGYLAKQFTVFGQHVHIGCAAGDAAVRLTHGLSRYIPQFIALSAASPYVQAEDTAFDTARLHAVSVFPLAGHMPAVESWTEFERYFERMASFGIVRSMKDFYWDIRPKPEYGTIELRVCDTPLEIETAAAIAAYAQAICAWLAEEPVSSSIADQYLVYGYNRFQASRFGYAARVVDHDAKQLVSLRDQLLATLERVRPHARKLGGERAIELLARRAHMESNGARWMREAMSRHGSLGDLVGSMCVRWSGAKDAAPTRARP